MWYVMTNEGCVGEYEYINDALERADMLEDAWVCSDEDEPDDSFDECGFDPYEGCYNFDC